MRLPIKTIGNETVGIPIVISILFPVLLQVAHSVFWTIDIVDKVWLSLFN